MRGGRQAAGDALPPAPREPGTAGQGEGRARRPGPARGAVSRERAEIVRVLHGERFCDAAPAQVWATLLDEGTYLASQSTFYRLLRTVHGDVRERRAQATHPAKAKPELVAHAPNQVWSWDITKLHGPAKWSYFYLYVILDVYSRKTVGWMIAARESATLAEELIAATITAEKIPARQLTLHADRGSSMASKPVALLLADLGVARSHSRPRVSNDCEYELVATSRVWPL